MSTTCYVSIGVLNIGGAVGDAPWFSPYVNYCLVDDATGSTFPVAGGGGNGQFSGNFQPPDVTTQAGLRTQVEEGIQGQETDTPGMTFVWLT